MKILLVSDLHYTLKQFDWLVRNAGRFDAVIIAGDLLDIASHLDFGVQIVVMRKYLDKLSRIRPLLVCSGNHDGNTKNDANEFVAAWLQQARRERLYVDGDNVFFGDTLITLFPWWDGEVTKREVDEQFSAASRLPRAKWIWVYHSPPDESPVCRAGKRLIGDPDLLHWIRAYTPDLVLTGHIHNSPFCPDGSWVDRIGTTWVFNAGRQIGEIPAHIVLDLQKRNAEWWSLLGRDERSLD